MFLLQLFIIFATVSSRKSVLVPIRNVHIDLLPQHTYIASHVINQIGLGVISSDLESCITMCYNHDFCRTAVFDGQLLMCARFEECSTQGQIVPNVQSTLISFLVCDGEPENMAFNQLSTAFIPVGIVVSNLKWVKDLPQSPPAWPFFVNDHIYVPTQNVINVYETESYALVQTIELIPVSSTIFFVFGDSQGTFIYFRYWDSNLYMYSSQTNIVHSTTSSWTNFVLCYSASFIVVTAWSSNVADVYLRNTMNNSASFIYRISNWNRLDHCFIINDQQLIGAIRSGGLQTTMLSKTIYNSTIVTIPLNTTYLPTGPMVSVDAAGRLYTASNASQNVSLIFLPDGRLIGLHEGTRASAGKTSKYKFIFMSATGTMVSIYEYMP